AGQSHMARNVGWVDEGDPTNSSDQSCWVSCLDPTYVQMRFPCILLVEVLSPTTERTDRTEKLEAYRRISFLQEYVIAEQDVAQIEVYRRAHG
ncbi:MAG: Uma2 family endonuclease, partial [Hyphomicrobium sp.]